MEARVPVRTIIIIWSTVRGMPNTLAMKREQMPMYSAVPSMLMVAPRGRTKDAISRFTPSFVCTFCIFTGRVPAEEQVVKAMAMASDMPRKKVRGLM